MNTVEKISSLYRVYEPRLEGLKDQILKLSRKAQKLGAIPIVLRETGKVEDVPVTRGEVARSQGQDPDLICGDQSEVLYYRRFVEIEITGQAPKFAGWNLAAGIEVADEGNILRKAPSCQVELPQFRSCKPFCDHCKTVRVRRETFVVIHDDGAVKQVGSDCLKDFLGHKDPHSLAKLAELFFSIQEVCGEAEDYEGCPGGGERERLSIQSFLKFVACAVRKLGYISGKRAFEDTTGRTVSTAQTACGWQKPFRNAVLNKDYFLPEEVDVQRAEAARQFVLDTLGAKDAAQLSDFEHNLLTVCKSEVLEVRNTGIVAYVIAYHSRETEKAAIRSTQRYYGTPKQRARKVEIQYLRSTGFDSQFGYTFIHNFAGPEGERLVWKTSTGLSYDAGQKIVATFTVKEHSVYNDNLQTLITRFVDETPQPAPAGEGHIIQNPHTLEVVNP